MANENKTVEQFDSAVLPLAEDDYFPIWDLSTGGMKKVAAKSVIRQAVDPTDGIVTQFKDPGSATPDLVRVCWEFLDRLGAKIFYINNEGGGRWTDSMVFLRGSAVGADPAFHPQLGLRWLNQSSKRAFAITFGYTGDGSTTVLDHGDTITVDAGNALYMRKTDDVNATVQLSGDFRCGSITAPVQIGRVGPSNEPGIRAGLTATARWWRSGADAWMTDDSVDVGSLSIAGSSLSSSLAGVTPGAFGLSALTWVDVAAARSAIYSGGIVDGDIASGASIDGTKVDQGSTAARGTLALANSGDIAAETNATKAVTIADVIGVLTARRKGSAQPATTVSSTTTETTILQQTLTGVVAGQHYRLRARGHIANSSGSAVTYRLRVKLGATTLIASDALSIATAVNTKKWTLTVDLFEYTDTAHQDLLFDWLISAGSANEAPNFPTATQGGAIGGGLGTVDMTTNPDLIVTIQMGSATADFTITSWYLERIT